MTRQRKPLYTAHQVDMVLKGVYAKGSEDYFTVVERMLKDYAVLLRRGEEAALQEL